MKLSIVTTLYKSAPYVREFYERISQEALKITHEYEIIFVNDGSPDDSLKIALSIYEIDKKTKVVDLSRNFGHHKAMMSGLSIASGEHIFLIDVDLEEEPELLGTFWKELHRDDDTDVIYGIQQRRKGKWFERMTGALFYKIFNTLSDDLRVEENLSTVRLMKKNYVQSLFHYQDNELYIGPIWNLVGFNQKGYVFQKQSRGQSSYSFYKKYHLFINLIVSYSTKPLYLVFYTGLSITFFSVLYVIYLIMKKLFFSMAIDGWTTMVASIWLLGGVIIFFIGIISIYISKIFIETRHRPMSIIKNIYK